MFQVIDQDENYTFEIFHKQDSIECANLLAKAFTTCNPYEIYMKTTYEQFYDDALALCQSIAYSELSIIARHKDTKEIDAIVQGVDVKTFNSDESESESESGLHDNCRRLDPIMPLLQESERRYLEYYERKFGELQENCVAHILMAGVRLSCIGRGLGTKIHQVFLDHTRQLNYKYVIVDATSPIINHIYTKKLKGNVFLSIYAPTWISKNSSGNDYQPMIDFDSHISLIEFALQAERTFNSE